MNKWLRRLIYLLITIVWLAIMFFPTFAFVLMQNGQIEIGATRVFLLNDVDTPGIGLQTNRHAKTEDGVMCERGSIIYLIWSGNDANQNATYCSCDDGSERIRDGSWCRLP
jgi:hypothetical protein